jgi:hypothetical protein
LQLQLQGLAPQQQQRVPARERPAVARLAQALQRSLAVVLCLSKRPAGPGL